MLTLIFFLVAISKDTNLLPYEEFIKSAKTFDYYMSFLTYLIALVGFICGIGLLQRHEWARKAIIWIAGVSIFLMFFNLAIKISTNLSSFDPQFSFGNFIGLIYNSFIIGYFNKRDIIKFYRG